MTQVQTNPEKDLTEFILTYNANFIARINAEPTLFKKIALDTATRALELEQNNPTADSKYFQAAIDIFSVMGQGVGIIQTFAEILAAGNLDAIQPGVFLDTVDALPEVDVAQSQEIILAISKALQASQSGTISFFDVFYQNYLGEYLANMFNVTAVENLSQRPELFAASTKLVTPEHPDVLFTIFGEANDLLKNNLADTYYSFNEMRDELNK